MVHAYGRHRMPVTQSKKQARHILHAETRQEPQKTPKRHTSPSLEQDLK
ncbi:Saccharolysin [Venturia inaequalis]|nr:Saccharolysin [Venturia inaequalis]